jgi:hypothetical protein
VASLFIIIFSIVFWGYILVCNKFLYFGKKLSFIYYALLPTLFHM